MPAYRLIVEKSTVPVETGKWVEHTIRVNIRGKKKFDVASNPEFLREGSAIEDFIHPDRMRKPELAQKTSVISVSLIIYLSLKNKQFVPNLKV